MSHLEALFELQLRALKLPRPDREYKFHPDRKFRFDFAWVKKKLAVEIDGGTRGFGRHNRHEGYKRDCEKQALAVQRGWRLYRFTSDQVTGGDAIRFIEEEFKG